jgi:hypothetical protein
MSKINNTPTEFQEQMALVDYLEYMLAQHKIVKFTAIPQNMYTRSIMQKVKAKREGVRAGFPDLVIVTNNEVIFLEMKRTKKGYVRPEQIEWLALLDKKQTVTGVAYGADDAIKFIQSILGEK